MIVKALMENTACSGEFSAEHGLSLYLEACGHKFLFDTGQSGAFAENAGKLGVDLADIDFTVLSHGHYDHGGGLRTFLTANDHAPVYLSRHAFEKHGNAEGKEIGLDPSLAADPRLVYTDTSYKIADGLELFSCNDRELCFPIDSAGLTMNIENKLRPIYIAKILLERTDEDHVLTTNELIDILEREYHISAHRTTVSDDIQVLAQAGLDVDMIKSTQNKYRVLSRTFDLAEIKLLIDAVESSKFITEKKSESLIKKLQKQASIHSADALKRNLKACNCQKRGHLSAEYIQITSGVQKEN